MEKRRKINEVKKHEESRTSGTTAKFKASAVNCKKLRRQRVRAFEIEFRGREFYLLTITERITQEKTNMVSEYDDETLSFLLHVGYV